MIAGFITVIVLIEAPVFGSVLTSVFTRAQSSLHNTRWEQVVITPLAPLRRDRETERQRRPGTGQHPLIF